MSGPPTMPALKCPDCGAPMRLQPTPSTFKTPNPFVYLCDRRAAGCGGLMSAHPDGTPQGAPVAAELRRARRMTHQVFDRLWQTARTITLSPRRAPPAWPPSSASRTPPGTGLMPTSPRTSA